jgi:HlyD family secretion protein
LSQGNLIIQQGLALGEEVVSSDTSQYNKFKQLSLTE